MPPLVPLQFGGLVIFRLFGIEGHIEPTPTRLLFTRFVGGIMVVVGLGLVVGLLGP